MYWLVLEPRAVEPRAQPFPVRASASLDAKELTYSSRPSCTHRVAVGAKPNLATVGRHLPRLSSLVAVQGRG